MSGHVAGNKKTVAVKQETDDITGLAKHLRLLLEGDDLTMVQSFLEPLGAEKRQNIIQKDLEIQGVTEDCLLYALTKCQAAVFSYLLAKLEQWDGGSVIWGRGKTELEGGFLHLACTAAGREHHIRSIVKKKPDEATRVNDKGSTALHYAAAYGTVEYARILLEAGADPYARNEYSEDAFRLARVNTKLDILGALDDFHANKFNAKH